MLAQFLIKRMRAPNVLGPILFLIYVNHLPLSLTNTCADMFTDDTTIGTSSNSIDPKLNLCISHLDTNSRLLQIVIMI